MSELSTLDRQAFEAALERRHALVIRTGEVFNEADRELALALAAALRAFVRVHPSAELTVRVAQRRGFQPVL